MPHRAHLFSLRIAHALREALREAPYGAVRARRDLLAGVSVGLVAIPLAMALAIASGVPPQFGLYSAIVAGFVIPLCGGSRYSVSGPTAAFDKFVSPCRKQGTRLYLTDFEFQPLKALARSGFKPDHVHTFTCCSLAQAIVQLPVDDPARPGTLTDNRLTAPGRPWGDTTV